MNKKDIYLIISAIFFSLLFVFIADNKIQANTLSIALEMESNASGVIQVFYDTGAGFNEIESQSLPIVADTRKSYLFNIPSSEIKVLRVDPINNIGSLVIHKFSYQKNGKTIKTFELTDFDPRNDISNLKIIGNTLNFKSGNDSIFIIKDSSYLYKPTIIDYSIENFWKILKYFGIIFAVAVLLFYLITMHIAKDNSKVNYFYILIGLFFFAYILHLPVTIYTVSPHDDALFWTRAYRILQGKWLGEYSNLTLAKGATFSILLAINSISGLPITLTLGLIFIFSVYNLVRVLKLAGLKESYSILLFSLLLFHPALHNIRIIRDNIYPSLTLIILASLVEIIIDFKNNSLSLKKYFFYGVAYGLFWTTREEGYWILPGVATVFAICLLQKTGKERALKLLKNLGSIFAGAYFVIFSISSINLISYGKYQDVDMKGEFSNTLKLLMSVNVEGGDRPFVPVSNLKRELIYKVSPTFNELRPYFDGPGRGWTKFGCDLYPETCGEYQAGWFLWALRDAVASRGMYINAESADEYYKKINKEIQIACQKKLIDCRVAILPFMPYIDSEMIRKIPAEIHKAIGLLTLNIEVPVTGGISTEPISELVKIKAILNNPLTTPSLNELEYSKKIIYSTDVKKILINIYNKILVIILPLGFILYILLLIRSSKNIFYNPIFIVAGVTWIFLVSRILLLIIVEISSFPGLIPLYVSSGYPLALLASFLSIVAFISLLGKDVLFSYFNVSNK